MKSSNNINLFTTMPTAVLMPITFMSGVVSFYYGYIVAKVIGPFIEVANTIPLKDWGAEGYSLLTMICLCAFMSWTAAAIFSEGGKELKLRMFAVK